MPTTAQHDRDAGDPAWADRIAAQLPYDMGSDAYRDDPYPFYEQLRRPVHRTPVGALVVTGHHACAGVLRDPRFGHGAATAGETTHYGVRARSFLLTDPPYHDARRGRVSAAFTPRAAERLRPQITRRVDGLLRRALQAGEADVVADIARPLVSGVVLEDLLGLPAGRCPRFQQAAELLARAFDPDQVTDPATRPRIARARLDIVRELREALAHRAPGTSVIGTLTGPVLPGQAPVPFAEVVSTCGQLIAAGYETSVGFISNAAHHLLAHPDQLTRLALTGPSEQALQYAVEELLRFDPPIQLALRSALADAAVAGVPAPRGTVVMLLPGAANRDPDVHPDPGTLDLARRPRHLAFGLGPHVCLGAPLARLMARTVLDRLVRCRPRLCEEHVRYGPGRLVHSVQRLRIRLDGPAS